MAKERKLPLKFWLNVYWGCFIGIILNIIINFLYSFIISIPVALFVALCAVAVGGNPPAAAYPALLISHFITMLIGLVMGISKMGEAITESKMKAFEIMDLLEDENE